MTPVDFKEWRAEMGFRSQKQAAEALGVHEKTVRNWETGVAPISLTVRLAMAALFHKMRPWDER